MSQTSISDHLMRMGRLDWSPPHRQPSGVQVVLATIVSLVGSLVGDAVIVAIGTRVFPSTKGYCLLYTSWPSRSSLCVAS